MIKTLSDSDELNILNGLGLRPKRLLSFFDVIRCEIEKTGNSEEAMKVAGLAFKGKTNEAAGFALVVESTLCLQGSDISTWASTWAKALRMMQLNNTLPELSKLFPDAPFDETSLANLTSGKEQVWSLPQESDVKQEATRLTYGPYGQHLNLICI